ncbi:STAGA complex 65 subunit gamma [Habropoda laboriosa]|uniref:STAGA complex 65 subunit gamma n=1 Tax=Habropoda laboriosa TaxID=597456 RepID=A0A0L7QTG5_9HYME|nr:STAGA complex 65 subunit gamma [Habropoda laboriosa]
MKSAKNTGTGSLWGELPARETVKQEVITPDTIENVWRQVMEESSNIDCDFQMDRQPEYIQLPMGNLHVLNTINLHQQLREDGMVLGNMTTIEAQDHAVIILLAHIGFEKSSDIAIETLTDIADHFLRRMTLLMKVAYEQKDHGFPDIVERVLLETGVGGVAALHDYYQEYILKFEGNMKKKVEAMMEKQRQLELNAYSSKMVLDEAANKLQFEELDEFGNVYREVPTLQLLDPEMGFPPSLDAGFQMLYSLEQDELNNLEVEEEEVNVSDSPSTGQRPDTSSDKKKS